MISDHKGQKDRKLGTFDYIIGWSVATHNDVLIFSLKLEHYLCYKCYYYSISITYEVVAIWHKYIDIMIFSNQYMLSWSRYLTDQLENSIVNVVNKVLGL